MFRNTLALTLSVALVWVGASWPVQAEPTSIVVASTTSTQDSGLFGHVLPLFKARSGIDVKVVAQGTGQALETGRRGDADVVFVHAKAQEEKFVADGFGVKRFDVMYNDFVLIGPKADPARLRGAKDIVAALKAIHLAKAPFVSRGDKSGTHAAELALWKIAGLDPAGAHLAPVAGGQPKAQAPVAGGQPKAQETWYRSIGQGMGAALNTAAAMGAYVLADRGTWISFKGKATMDIVVEGDQRLFNQYGIMLVNPAKHPHVKRGPGQAFVDWIVSPEAQAVIAGYKVAGEQLFFPNAAAVALKKAN